MSKEAVFTMKLEPELRAEFMAEAEASHRPGVADPARIDARVRAAPA